MKVNNFKISDGEKLYIDGIELKNVKKYKLSHSRAGIAKLKITLDVNVNHILACKDDEISHLIVDYENEILIIDGKEVAEAVIVSIPCESGWSKRKLFHANKFLGEGSCRKISIKVEGAHKECPKS